MGDNRETVKLIIEIPKEYKALFDTERCKSKFDSLATNEFGYVLRKAFENGIPLDSVMAEIERLKHEYPDITGYRWWNNAIDNCLHTIRDECDMREVSEQ